MRVFTLLAVFAIAPFIGGGGPPLARGEGPLRHVDLRKTTVGGELGERIARTIEKNILAIDHEKSFLRYFREKKRPPFSYVGLGKEIDAVTRLAYFTGDKRLLELKERLVKETIQTQLDDGYIGIFATDRLGQWWDLHELSYIIYGLVQDYRYFGDREALAAARRAADYIMAHRPQRLLVFHVSSVGFERAFIALGEATSDPKYLAYVNFHDSLRGWHDPVGGHTYDFLNLCLAQLDLYEKTGDRNLLGQAHRAVKYLTTENALLVDGTCSLKESWHTTQVGQGDAGETCVATYLLKVWDALLRAEGDSLYGDLMERAIYNALFAAQSPSGRELRKYTALAGPREYYRGEAGSDFQRDTYCCPNNFRRAIADLPGYLYYHDGNSIFVNLYNASQTTVDLDDQLRVQLRQQTDYPNSGDVVIRVTPSRSARFAMRLRIPRWCAAATVSVNGQSSSAPTKPGSWCVLDRTWAAGDQIKLQMPMPIRVVKGRASQAGKVAVLRGPQLFCFNPVLNASADPTLAGVHGERGKQRAALVEEFNSVEAQLLVPEGLPPNADGSPAQPSPARQALLARKARLEREIGSYRPVEQVLQDMAFDVSTLSGPVPDATVRPDGMALELKAWGPGADRRGPANLKVRLTEFPDPGGELTHLPVKNGQAAVKDELFFPAN